MNISRKCSEITFIIMVSRTRTVLVVVSHMVTHGHYRNISVFIIVSVVVTTLVSTDIIEQNLVLLDHCI